MSAALRAGGAAAFAGALGACAMLSDLNAYRSGSCPEGCDDASLGVSLPGDGEVATVVDAAAVDMNAPHMDAESIDDEVAEGGHESGTLEGVGDVAEAGSDTGIGMDADDANDGSDGGTLGTGLVAFYRFDEASGVVAADSSGNNRTATLVGNASFSSGLQNNAVTLNGNSQYVSLPSGIASDLTSFSICAWVNLSASTRWSRIFDFGTGTTTYMFLTPNSGDGVRSGITIGGNGQEQQLNAPTLPTGSWQQVAVTLASNIGTLYVDGVQVAQNIGMTLNPESLGTTTQNWLGRSQFPGDPYLNGQLDNFRIYDRALSAAEVKALYTGHL